MSSRHTNRSVAYVEDVDDETGRVIEGTATSASVAARRESPSQSEESSRSGIILNASDSGYSARARARPEPSAGQSSRQPEKRSSIRSSRSGSDAASEDYKSATRSESEQSHSEEYSEEEIPWGDDLDDIDPDDSASASIVLPRTRTPPRAPRRALPRRSTTTNIRYYGDEDASEDGDDEIKPSDSASRAIPRRPAPRHPPPRRRDQRPDFDDFPGSDDEEVEIEPSDSASAVYGRAQSPPRTRHRFRPPPAPEQHMRRASTTTPHGRVAPLGYQTYMSSLDCLFPGRYMHISRNKVKIFRPNASRPGYAASQSGMGAGYGPTSSSRSSGAAGYASSQRGTGLGYAPSSVGGHGYFQSSLSAPSQRGYPMAYGPPSTVNFHRGPGFDNPFKPSSQGMPPPSYAPSYAPSPAGYSSRQPSRRAARSTVSYGPYDASADRDGFPPPPPSTVPMSYFNPSEPIPAPSRNRQSNAYNQPGSHDYEWPPGSLVSPMPYRTPQFGAVTEVRPTQPILVVPVLVEPDIRKSEHGVRRSWVEPWYKPNFELDRGGKSELLVVAAVEHYADTNTESTITLVRQQAQTEIDVPVLRWLHVERDSLNLSLLEDLVRGCPHISEQSRRVAMALLIDANEKMITTSANGRFFKDESVIRYDAKYEQWRKESSESVIFLSAPYLLTKHVARKHRRDDVEHRARTLLQFLYQFDPGDKKDTDQVISKTWKHSKDRLHISQLWCLIIDDVILTCSETPFSDIRGPSINVEDKVPFCIVKIETDQGQFFDFTIVPPIPYVDFVRQVYETAEVPEFAQILGDDMNRLTAERWLELMKIEDLRELNIFLFEPLPESQGDSEAAPSHKRPTSVAIDAGLMSVSFPLGSSEQHYKFGSEAGGTGSADQPSSSKQPETRAVLVRAPQVQNGAYRPSPEQLREETEGEGTTSTHSEDEETDDDETDDESSADEDGEDNNDKVKTRKTARAQGDNSGESSVEVEVIETIMGYTSIAVGIELSEAEDEPEGPSVAVIVFSEVEVEVLETLPFVHNPGVKYIRASPAIPQARRVRFSKASTSPRNRGPTAAQKGKSILRNPNYREFVDAQRFLPLTAETLRRASRPHKPSPARRTHMWRDVAGEGEYDETYFVESSSEDDNLRRKPRIEQRYQYLGAKIPPSSILRKPTTDGSLPGPSKDSPSRVSLDDSGRDGAKNGQGQGVRFGEEDILYSYMDAARMTRPFGPEGNNAHGRPRPGHSPFGGPSSSLVRSPLQPRRESVTAQASKPGHAPFFTWNVSRSNKEREQGASLRKLLRRISGSLSESPSVKAVYTGGFECTLQDFKQRHHFLHETASGDCHHDQNAEHQNPKASSSHLSGSRLSGSQSTKVNNSEPRKASASSNGVAKGHAEGSSVPSFTLESSMKTAVDSNAVNDDAFSKVDTVEEAEALMKTLFDLSRNIITQFIPEDVGLVYVNDPVMKKCWGALDRIFRHVKLLLVLRDSSGNQQCSISDFTIRKLQNVGPSTPQMKSAFSECIPCRNKKRYPSVKHAVDHLHQDHGLQNKHGPKHKVLDDPCLVWIQVDGDAAGQKAADANEDIELALGIIRHLIKDLYELQRVGEELHMSIIVQQPQQSGTATSTSRASQEGKEGKQLPPLPLTVVRAFEEIVSLHLHTAHRLSLITRHKQKKARRGGGGGRRHHKPGEAVVTRVGLRCRECFDAASAHLDQAKRVLIFPVTAAAAGSAAAARSARFLILEPVGPHYMMAVVLAHLQNRPVQSSSSSEGRAGPPRLQQDIVDLYGEHVSKLQFDVSQRPQRSLFLDLRVLEEELAAVSKLARAQHGALDRFGRVLDPFSYGDVAEAARRADVFALERDFLERQKIRLEDRLEEYRALSEKSKDLKEQVRQGIEILEEGHGKAIRVFTIVTLFFLPLTFVSGFMGMNTVDIRDTDRDQTLFWSIAVPLTVGILSVAFVYGYRGDAIAELVSELLERRRSSEDAAFLAQTYRSLNPYSRNDAAQAPRGGEQRAPPPPYQQEGKGGAMESEKTAPEPLIASVDVDDPQPTKSPKWLSTVLSNRGFVPKRLPRRKTNESMDV